jgi:hypothetical protein
MTMTKRTHSHRLVKALKRDVRAISLEEGRRVGMPGHAIVEEYLEDRLSEIGCEPYDGDSFRLPYRMKKMDFTNLIGVIPGRNRSKPPLLIGAHYDSVIDAPCADDNAAAVAIALAAGDMVNMDERLDRDLALVMDLVGHDICVPGALLGAIPGVGGLVWRRGNSLRGPRAGKTAIETHSRFGLRPCAQGHGTRTDCHAQRHDPLRRNPAERGAWDMTPISAPPPGTWEAADPCGSKPDACKKTEASPLQILQDARLRQMLKYLQIILAIVFRTATVLMSP